MPWDHNLAFGVQNGGGGVGGERPGGAPNGGLQSGSNVLAERFRSVDDFQALYEQQLEVLRSTLFESGVADEVLAV